MSKSLIISKIKKNIYQKLIELKIIQIFIKYEVKKIISTFSILKSIFHATFWEYT